jgi:hypothetical protein
LICLDLLEPVESGRRASGARAGGVALLVAGVRKEA